MERKSYPSDVSDDEWAFVVPVLTLISEDAPQRVYPLREVFNGLRYIARSGAPRRMMPNDLPPLACCLTAALKAAGGVDLNDFNLCRSLLELLQVGFIPDPDASGNGEVILCYPGLDQANMSRVSEMGKAEKKTYEQTQNGVVHKHHVSA